MELRPILSTLLRAKTAPLLIALQVAMTLAIVCNALYIISDRLASASRPSGVDEANSFVVALSPARRIDDLQGMQMRDIELIRAVPGVTAVAWTNQVPMGRSGWSTGLNLEGQREADGISAAQYMSPDSLLTAFNLQLIEGRDFNPQEVVVVDPEQEPQRPQSAILTRALAERLWPEQTQFVGKSFYNGGGEDARPLQVVGVVETLQTPWTQTDNREAGSSMILPIRYLDGNTQYIVRCEPGQRAQVMREVEKQLLAVRSDRVLRWVRTLEQIRDRRYAGERLMAGLLIGVTAFLMLITASGIVGMASLWVNQRRKQIGVRRAMGARRSDILRYFLVENALISTGGVALGVALALLLNDVLVRSLGLARLPPGYLLATMAAMWILGLAAVLAPAIRASMVPPAVATRTA